MIIYRKAYLLFCMICFFIFNKQRASVLSKKSCFIIHKTNRNFRRGGDFLNHKKGGFVEEDRKDVLQWHPAFYADLQIEFQEETYKLMFQNEYPLGTKPMLVDILVIKEKKRRKDSQKYRQDFPYI